MSEPARLMIDKNALNDLVELLKVQPEDKLVIWLKKPIADEHVQAMVGTFESAGLRKQVFLLQILEEAGEVFVVRRGTD